MSDPEPSYVGIAGAVNGYVTPGYQKYYSTASGAPPPDPGTGVPPPAPVPDPSPQTPPDWPVLPPTLPPVGCPPLDSTWAAGPTNPGGSQSYTPPTSNPNDDGITFPASPSDLMLRNQWHGLPSTLNPLNITLINLQIEQIVHDAIQSTKPKTEISPGTAGLQLVYPDTFTIQNTIQQKIVTQMLQGNGLWYELVLKPVTNGPFVNYYVIESTPLAIPKTLDLSAPSTG